MWESRRMTRSPAFKDFAMFGLLIIEIFPEVIEKLFNFCSHILFCLHLITIGIIHIEQYIMHKSLASNVFFEFGNTWKEFKSTKSQQTK